MLTKGQRMLAEQHAYMVGVIVGGWIRRKPWMRCHEDSLASAANLALCKAALTYREDSKLPFFAWARLVMSSGLRTAAQELRRRGNVSMLCPDRMRHHADHRSDHDASESGRKEIREHLLRRMQQESSDDRKIAEMVMDGHSVSKIVREALGKKMSGSSYLRVDRVRKIIAQSLTEILGDDVVRGWKKTNRTRSGTMRPQELRNRRVRRAMTS